MLTFAWGFLFVLALGGCGAAGYYRSKANEYEDMTTRALEAKLRSDEQSQKYHSDLLSKETELSQKTLEYLDERQKCIDAERRTGQYKKHLPEYTLGQINGMLKAELKAIVLEHHCEVKIEPAKPAPMPVRPDKIRRRSAAADIISRQEK